MESKEFREIVSNFGTTDPSLDTLAGETKRRQETELIGEPVVAELDIANGLAALHLLGQMPQARTDNVVVRLQLMSDNLDGYTQLCERIQAFSRLAPRP